GREAVRHRPQKVFASAPTWVLRYVQLQAYRRGEAGPRREEWSVATELGFDLDPSVHPEFGTVASAERVAVTAAALEGNGIRAIRAANAAEAKRVVLGLIPDGSQVHHGASLSLEATGITD